MLAGGAPAGTAKSLGSCMDTEFLFFDAALWMHSWMKRGFLLVIWSRPAIASCSSVKA